MGVRIRSELKIGYLRQIAAAAKVAASTLKEALIAAQGAIFTGNFRNGRILINTSGAGQSASFQIIANGQEWTQENVSALTEELIQLVDLTVAQGTPDSADPDLIEALFAQMLENINTGNLPSIGIRQQMGDFSGLNYPSTSLS